MKDNNALQVRHNLNPSMVLLSVIGALCASATLDGKVYGLSLFFGLLSIFCAIWSLE